MSYTASEYTDMIICYGAAGESALAAAELYAEKYPDREHPSYRTIIRCVQRTRDTGSVIPRQRSVERAVLRNVEDEEEILRRFEDDPRSSIRRVARALGLPNALVHRVVREEGLHPYHYQRVQQLLPRDEEQRAIFCQGFLAQCRRNESFPNFILWTDEALFTPNGIFNSKNFVLWSEENPHAIRRTAFQYRWQLHVWAGVIENQIIGPYFLPPRLNGERYAYFLENDLPPLLENLPLNVRLRLIYQQDGAPPHFSRNAQQVLNNRFAGRWMGRGGPITWPARSPDLNVLDYFVWGHIKAQVEPVREGTVEEVRAAIIAAFDTVTPDMAQRATQQIVRRAELCLQVQGRHFEQLLH
ncbi:uncharacterized protein [Cardiocondyla obscurior]|uniref:uncharacterized protein n=1 Tax=Cardiocondyla obscurior TaxID=286306 RepID=UPI00396580F4